MILVGTSLGGCLRSLAKEEVNIDDVLVIITRTNCKSVEDLVRVVEKYYEEGNKFATESSNYDMTGCDLDELKSLAIDLWNHGKIHQPRTYNNFPGFVHLELTRNEIWIPLAPSPKTDDQLVVDAYEKYQILRNLMS